MTRPQQSRAVSLVRDALGTAELRRLQLVWWLVSTGTWAFTIVLAVYAYDVGGAGGVGLAALVRTVPAAFAAPVTGLLADQRSRRDMLLSITAARAAVVAAVGACIAAGAPFGVVLVLAAAFTMLNTGHKPAQAGLLTALAKTPSQLARANALWSALDNAGFLLGSLLGGALVGLSGTEIGMALTAAPFALAAAGLVFVQSDPVPAHRQALDGSTVAREAALGVQSIAADSALRRLVGLSTATTFVHGAVDVLIVVLALDLLLIGDAGVGWLSAAWGAGGLVGGTGALALLGARRLAKGLIAAGLLVGLPLCVIAAEPSVPVAFAALVLLGVGSALIEVGVLTFMQRLSSDEVLARAFAVQELGLQLSTGLGAIVASALVTGLGARGALLVVGPVLPLLVVLLGRSLSGLGALREVSERRLALVRGLDLFAPLPLAMQENLAARMKPRSLPAGTVVTREGEPGDAYYVIAAGELEVSRRGEFARNQGVGEGFGEIALVHDVARTATVTAAVDVELLVLERDAFLTAIAAQRRAKLAADNVVATREPSLTRTP